jgi:hypothetical protein
MGVAAADGEDGRGGVKGVEECLMLLLVGPLVLDCGAVGTAAAAAVVAAATWRSRQGAAVVGAES